MHARMAMAVPLRIAIYALGLLGAAVFDAVQGTGMDVTLAVAFGLGLHALIEKVLS